MAPDSFHDLLTRFEQERPTWEQVAAWMEAQLESLVREARLPAQVGARAKDVDSLVLKGYSKQRFDLTMFRDRAAARVATYYEDDRPRVVELICDRFDCPDGPDDLGLELGKAGMGYGAVHCDLLLDRQDIEADLAAIEGPIWCEVQVHTLASSLWAATAHPLAYKSPVELDDPTARAVNRLSVLTEVYDAELLKARHLIEDHPDYPAGRVLQALERYYFSLFGEREHDPAVSRLVIEQMMPTLNAEEIRGIDALMERFFQDHRANLDFIYRDSNPGAQRVPLLLQPEAMLFFERLTQDAATLRAVWNQALPEQWYDDLVAVWGGEP